MNNSVENRPYFYSSQRIQYYWEKYQKFALQGLILTAVNLAIFLSICIHQKLRERKEFIIIRGLASVDIITGLGALTSGIGRLIVIATGTINSPVSSRWCLLMPWSWLFMLKPHINGLMLTVVSLDRFWSVAFPIKYYKRTQNQITFLIALPYLHAVCPLLYMLYDSFANTENLYSPMCLTSVYMGTNWAYYRYSEPFLSTLSVLLYCVTFFVLWRKKRPAGISDRSYKNDLKFQRKLTKTLGLTALCTFIFETVPRLVLILSSYMGGKVHLKEISFIGHFLFFIVDNQYTIRNLNPLSNIVIYTLRIRDIRMGIIRMFTCKRLTEADLKHVRKSKVTPN